MVGGKQGSIIAASTLINVEQALQRKGTIMPGYDPMAYYCQGCGHDQNQCTCGLYQSEEEQTDQSKAEPVQQSTGVETLVVFLVLTFLVIMLLVCVLSPLEAF